MKLLLVLLCAPVFAQPLAVYSEFARLDKSGNAIAPASPREILSPAIPRNAFSSFQVAVQVPASKHWHLYVGQNPPNAVRVTMYRESGDALEAVELPAEADGPQVFWMDVWTDRSAPVQRIKIEPELFIDDDWVIYPMEARVVDATVPDGTLSEGFEPPAAVMKGFLCSSPATSAAAGSDVAKLRYRNAQQDLALAARAPRAELTRLLGSCETAPPAENPEWYLKFRDYLLRLR